MSQQSQSDDDEFQSDPTEFLALKSKVYQNQLDKYERLRQRIQDVYLGLLQQCLDFRQANVPQNYTIIPQDRKGNADPNVILNQLQTIIMICMNTSKDICNQLTQRDQSLEGQYDDTLQRLEREIRSLLRNEEKLRIYIECAQLRVEEFKMNEKKLEEELSKRKINVPRKSNQKPKKTQPPPPQPQHQQQQQQDEQEQLEDNVSSKVKIQSPQNFNMTLSLAKSEDQNKKFSRTESAKKTMSNYAVQLTKENQNLRIQVKSANKEKDMQYQKLTFDLRRMEIKVEQLEKENKQMRKELQEVNQELSKIKELKNEEERMKWKNEASSDKNPHLMEFFKKKQEEKNKEITTLTKNLKKFAIVEKKLLVKEKAFEVERAEYQDRLLYLNERVNNLVKINDTIANGQNRQGRLYNQNVHENQ